MTTRDQIAREHCIGAGVELGPGQRPTQVGPDSTLAFVDKRGPEELARYFGSSDVVTGERLESFTSGSFDFLIAHHVLEHSSNVIEELMSWMSYVRDGGVVFLSVPDRRHCPDSTRLETPPNHFVSDYILGIDDSSFESREHIYSFLSAWHAVGALADRSKEEAAHLTAMAVHKPENDLHWHVFTETTLRFVVETAARLSGRSAVIKVLTTGGAENEHRILASLIQASGPDQEIDHLKTLRANFGRFVSGFCLNALESQPLYTLSPRDHGKIFVAEAGKARWVREPETLIARGIDDVPAQYVEFGRARDDVVGDEIVSATLSLAMGRQRAVAQRVRLATGRGLEISPGSAPLIRREDAGDLIYCDKVGGDAWTSTYGKHGEMMKTDITLGTKRLDEVFPAAHFDYVVSSHVLEHIPDFVGFFKSVETVLKPNGDLVMIVPDKRYTFDILREPSSIEQIERAHKLQLVHPSDDMIRDFFTHIDHAATAEGLWAGTHQPKPSFSADRVEERLSQINPETIDLHCWVFTPATMWTLLGYVCEVHVPSLSIVDVSDTPHGSIEFLVHMRKLGH